MTDQPAPYVITQWVGNALFMALCLSLFASFVIATAWCDLRDRVARLERRVDVLDPPLPTIEPMAPASPGATSTEAFLARLKGERRADDPTRED